MNPKVEYLLSLPQYAQRSPEWFDQRKGVLTASDVPTALGNNKYKSQWQLLLDKCGAGKPFTGNEATRWGNFYEDTAIEKYSLIKNKTVHSFGLIIHKEHSWLGGSPDGITSDGILLEVKCPLRRKIIHGEVPEHYLAQVLINMEICDLDMAHFIEFVPGKSDSDFEINIVEVPRNRKWFEYSLPVLREFWDSVNEYKQIGIENHPKYNDYITKSESIKERKEYRSQGITLDLKEPKKKEYSFLEEE